MKVKVSTASAPVLDWLVTYTLYGEAAHYIWKHTPVACRYSTDWSQAGPIIENHIFRLEDFAGEGWSAFGLDGAEGEGSTPLIAAMRCYVVSKLGEEVEVPDDLA